MSARQRTIDSKTREDEGEGDGDTTNTRARDTHTNPTLWISLLDHRAGDGTRAFDTQRFARVATTRTRREYDLFLSYTSESAGARAGGVLASSWLQARFRRRASLGRWTTRFGRRTHVRVAVGWGGGKLWSRWALSAGTNEPTHAHIHTYMHINAHSSHTGMFRGCVGVCM